MSTYTPDHLHPWACKGTLRRATSAPPGALPQTAALPSSAVHAAAASWLVLVIWGAPRASVSAARPAVWLHDPPLPPELARAPLSKHPAFSAVVSALHRQCAVLAAVPPAEAMHDDNAKLQLEVAALRLDAAERRFQGLADATEACLRHLRDSAPAPAAAAAPPVHRSVDLASWRSGAGVGFVVGVACGLGAAALLTWGGGRGTHQYRAGR